MYTYARMTFRFEDLLPAKLRESGLVLPLAVTTVAALCALRIYRRCFVHVSPDCLTIVYETRRRTILAASIDKKQKPVDDLTQSCHTRPLMYVMSILLYSNKTMVVVPPSSFFSVFTLPRTVLDENGEGRAMECIVEGIRATDGYIRMLLTVWYCIPLRELERYLAAVGPTAPNERIAVAVAVAARARAAELSVGLIINKSKRDEFFLGPFKAHLASKLMSEACVKLLNVTLENVLIAEKSINE